MNIIGLDFGTTNSTISYYNTKTQTLDSFKDRASGSDYIPSIISYEHENGDISIGDEAKLNLISEGFDSYENFKLRLGKDYDIVINKDKTKTERTPTQVASDFIKILLEKYKKNKGIEKIDSLVMTVPEIWLREKINITARENIENIYKVLEYNEFELYSEPEAAAAYFCWEYERNEDKNPKGIKYNGHIAVIDYGGGTLDVTLCEVINGDKINRLASYGFGEYNKTDGCAGVAFDVAVTERLIRKEGLSIPKESPQFLELRNRFEDEKIKRSEKITEKMELYYRDPLIVKGKPLFSLKHDKDGKSMEVYCDDLALCFNEINLVVLEKSLENIKGFCETQTPPIDYSLAAQDNFRVLLVGGFSNFIAVENETRKAFKSKIGYKDKRFERPISKTNRALSISRGADKKKKKIIEIVHLCEYSCGYILHGIGERYVRVIEYGTNIKSLGKPVFNEEERPVQVSIDRSGEAKFKIFTDRPGEGKVPLPLDESIKELFPNLDDRDNDYRIGFSINKNQVPMLHIKDKYGEMISTSLNKLIQRITARQGK
jgi:molecular chaperone DnaK